MEVRKIATCLIAVLLLGCEKNETLNKGITGTWYENTRWGEFILHEEYHFGEDGTLQILGTVMDDLSKETKGYTHKTVGNYLFKGDSLILRNQIVYSTGSHSYKKLEELTHTNTWERTSYKPIYNENKDTVTLSFNCPLNADCIPFPKLKRIN